MTGTITAAANGMAATVADVIILTRTATCAFVSTPSLRLLRHQRAAAVRCAN